jgi:transposase
MDQSHSDAPEGAPACARTADAGAPSISAGPERRFSAQRKLAAATRLLRGEPLETVARELNVTVARLSEWRDRALVGAEAAMKERERDGRDQKQRRQEGNPEHQSTRCRVIRYDINPSSSGCEVSSRQ